MGDGSFQETAPRKTTENSVKHRDGDVGSVVANHRGGGESSVVRNNTSFSNPWRHDEMWVYAACQL